MGTASRNGLKHARKTSATTNSDYTYIIPVDERTCTQKIYCGTEILRIYLQEIPTISMYNMGTASRNGLKHALTLEQRKQIMAEAAEQRYAEFLGGETKYTGGTVHEVTENSGPIEREFYEFYRTQRGEFTPEGATPMTTTHPTLSSNVKFMNFYPFADIETISPRPMLFITGENAHSREFSEDAYRLAAEPKELYIVPGAGHVDLYDRVGLIPFDKLESFFKEYLKK